MAVGTEIEYGVNITLRNGAMICRRRFPPRSQIVCITGRLWVTFDGDREDHVLRAGNWFLPARGARGAIIYAVETSKLAVLKGERVSFGMMLARLLRGRFALRS